MSNTDQYTAIIAHLKSLANPLNVAGMARFGINPRNTLGISVAVLRPLAKQYGPNLPLSEMLWQSQIHEARILAAYLGEPNLVTEDQMERWALDFDSWDICDQCCSKLFYLTPQAYSKALQWSRRDPEFVKRAGYVLMAVLAVKDKKAPNSQMEQFFTAILAGSNDRRNFVKKAVNWALRQIGKRNLVLNQKAIALAREIQKLDAPAAHWIASNAIIELTSPSVQSRLDALNLRGS